MTRSSRRAARGSQSGESMRQRKPIRSSTSSGSRPDRTLPASSQALQQQGDSPDDRAVGLAGQAVAGGRVQYPGQAVLDPAVVGEAVEPQPQRLQWGVLREQDRCGVHQLLDVEAVDGQHQRFAIGEVPVQGAGADARRLRDRVQRGVAGDGEGIARDLDDALAIVLARQPAGARAAAGP